jgi:hypothetical protein
MQLIERLIICKLIEELDTAGFAPVQFWDGEEYQTIKWKADSTEANKVQREKACIECVNSVGEGTLHFAPKTDLKAWGGLGVLLILGNGQDIISDYHCADHTPAFGPAIERVQEWIEVQS